MTDINTILNSSFKTKIAFIDELLMIEKPFLLDEAQQKKLSTLLEKYNFVITPDNYHLVYLNEQFLISSLINDYEKTMEVASHLETSKIPSEDKNWNLLENILINNYFVCTNETPLVFLQSPYAFIASCAIDPIQSLANFQYNKKSSIKEKEYIYQQGLLNNDISPSYLNEPYIEDDYMLTKFIQNPDELNFVKNVLLNKERPYSNLDEKQLLHLLNSSYKSIEEEINSMSEKNIDRIDMSIIQVLSLAFYAKKYLFQNEIDNYEVKTFNYCNNENVLGMHTQDAIYLFVDRTLNSMDVKSMIKTLHHEIEHAIQFKNISGLNIYEDSDIDLYSKDLLLFLIHGEKYINENYDTLTYEFDAEVKSLINASLLFKETFNPNDLPKIVKETNGLINKLQSTTQRRTSKRRMNAKKYNFDSLFDKSLKHYIHSDKLNRSVVKRVFPIIAYDYDLDSKNVARRPLSDLVYELNSVDNKLEETIYLKLISRRIDSRYDNQYQQNLDFLNYIIEEKEIDAPARIKLSKIIFEVYNEKNYENLKYINYLLNKVNKTK